MAELMREIEIDLQMARLCRKCYEKLLAELGVNEIEQFPIGSFFPCEECGKQDKSIVTFPRHYLEKANAWRN